MARKKQCEKRDEMRRAILDAAHEIRLEEGIGKVTVRRISEKIGYSTGVIYYHFSGKQDIIDEMNRQLDEEAYDTIKAFVDRDGTTRENIRNICSGMCKMPKSNPDDFQRLFKSRRDREKSSNIWIKIISEMLEGSAERSEISNSNLTVKTHCILSYILGCNILFRELAGRDGLDIDICTDTAVDLLCDGIFNMK